MTTKKHICEKCGSKMKYDRRSKTYLCPSCLYGAFLTDQAQRACVKRYRESEKGKDAEKRYEQTEKGKIARERYLKSEKYKQRRKEYNERLKESLAIARAGLAGQPRAKAPTREEKLITLVDAVQEYHQLTKRWPSPSNVMGWAEDEHQVKITPAEAQEFIRRAQHE